MSITAAAASSSRTGVVPFQLTLKSVDARDLKFLVSVRIWFST